VFQIGGNKQFYDLKNEIPKKNPGGEGLELE
jgi:hypothetical protein